MKNLRKERKEERPMSQDIWKAMRKALSWSFLGVFFTLLFGIFALYLALHEKKPDIVFEIIADANVLDVHKPLKDLTVTFDGEDIQKTRQNLRIFTISVRNTGEADVLQTAYDQQQPWGLLFGGARIVDEPRLIGSNSDYIKDSLHPRIKDDNAVEFSKVIFERGKYFTIEVQVLHSVDALPQIQPLGKIAGVHKQRVIRPQASKEPSFWQQLFAGGVLVHAVRAVIHVVGVVLFLFMLVHLSIALSILQHRRRQKRKRRYLAPVLSTMQPKPAKGLVQIVNRIGLDKAALKSVVECLTDESFLQKVREEVQRREEMYRRVREDKSHEPERSESEFLEHLIMGLGADVVECDDEGGVHVDKRLLAGVKALVNHVSQTPPPNDVAETKYPLWTAAASRPPYSRRGSDEPSRPRDASG
jgi:hypothetical protein